MLANARSINKYGCTTRGTTKAKGDTFLFPVCRNRDRPPIPGVAHIVISNDARSLTKTLSLPTAGHLNGFRERCVPRIPTAGFPFVARVEPELPLPVQIDAGTLCSEDGNGICKQRDEEHCRRSQP